MAGDWFWRAWQDFPYSVETGATAMEKAWGMGAFEYLAAHPDEAALFSEAMIGVHGEEPAAIAAAYDFSGFDTIIDVGGATGHLLATVLQAHPGTKGVLYDLPHVVSKAPELIAGRGLSDRVTIREGSFFDGVPEGGDAYLMSHIIHDWSVEQCLTILGHCRRAMKPSSKLLIVEFVLPEGNTPHFGKLLDMVMLAIPGGEERSGAEYAELLEKAGLRMTRVVPTSTEISIVEAVRDDAP
jgi:hypothetical protein